jgi:hydrogenase maturation protein HypF
VSAQDSCAVRVRITGVVQGVGFRPFVYRLARERGIAGWVLNGEDGVHVWAEGGADSLAGFVDALRTEPPPVARIASFTATAAPAQGLRTFEIRESLGGDHPTVRVSPDLPVCAACLGELFDPSDRRYGYPYINCTNCGPRYSIVLALPYDRERTTMRAWPLCAECRREYEDPLDRRFHAQPVACPACGPTYRLRDGGTPVSGADAIARTALLLAQGAIVAIKGIGGYHLACDASNAAAVVALRERKYRKERPFALMARDLAAAREAIALDLEAEAVLTSVERPIVLAPARRVFEGVAPENRELGVMLPYAPLHHLLFARGAPPWLVMTSANRSSEPIAYRDEDALADLTGIADAFLIGERPIARRVDDSVARAGPQGAAILRRSRGYAPRAVAHLPGTEPLLALGADLKNTVTLVVDGQAFVSQHIGDLEHLASREAFTGTVADLCAMYEVDTRTVTIAHDLHPGYHTTEIAQSFLGRKIGVQHHRAHVASVLAERGAWETPVVGFAFDGTGYGDDGTIWGGEVFAGSLAGGLERVAHLRPATLPGGEAAARFPEQAAAGFLSELGGEIDLRAGPFALSERYERARALVKKKVRTFTTTSVGRLFDTVAALCGFTREQTFEGQAAIWLEHVARASRSVPAYPFPFHAREFDHGALLRALVADRLAGRPVAEIAYAFHAALAAAILAASEELAAHQVVVSGGVFQNALLVELLAQGLGARLWLQQSVPPNDGGISLGQAALARAASREGAG